MVVLASSTGTLLLAPPSTYRCKEGEREDIVFKWFYKNHSARSLLPAFKVAVHCCKGCPPCQAETHGDESPLHGMLPKS